VKTYEAVLFGARTSRGIIRAKKKQTWKANVRTSIVGNALMPIVFTKVARNKMAQYNIVPCHLSLT
jgi:hypothetical protein